MRVTFVGDVFEWRGPAPFHFIRVSEDAALAIKDIAPLVTYGWGVIPATLTIGRTSVTTSLFPKDGGYLVPVKNDLRIPEKIAIGDVVDVTLVIGE